ncbi:MAG: NUDIX domain-containing protein [Candidatus Aenigmatarchaeota archaeon]
MRKDENQTCLWINYLRICGKILRKMVKFVNIGVVLNKNGEVLIVKRKRKEVTSTGKEFVWSFPGGVQEINETREERVVKEVLLETGYKVKPIKQINLRIHPDTLVLIAYFLCKLESEEPIQEIEEKDEIEEVKWVKPEELKNYFTTDIDPEVKKILKIN